MVFVRGTNSFYIEMHPTTEIRFTLSVSRPLPHNFRAKVWGKTPPLQGFPKPFRHVGRICPPYKALIGRGLMRGDIDFMEGT